MNATEIFSKLSRLSGEKQQEVSDFVEFLFEKENKLLTKPETKRVAGLLQGKIQILDGFDDPIEGMEEYYQ